MNIRDHFITTLRGETLGKINSQTSEEELFQNQTLRPILKLQNELYIELFKNYILKNKAQFSQFKVEKKLDYIENSILNDNKFRNLLIGTSIGLLQIEEYKLYSKNASALNKRIISMLIERLKSQVQLLDELENL
ncbi:MAG: glyoxalase [Flavobacteriaceae bacterium]|jgi:hypothetical protein|nr:glyoxalase [Flavobacteriaceae bacterium]